MRKRISAVLLALAMVLTTVLSPMAVEAAQEKVGNYEVVFPEKYVSTKSYPVIYVMPEDGYTMNNGGMVEKLQAAMKAGVSTDMLIVIPEFAEDTDLHAAMENLVAEIDAKYNTLDGASNRAIVGTGVGGYLAYVLGLTEKVETVVEPEAVEEAVPAEEPAEPEVVVTYEPLNAPKLFKYVGSIRGDFVSEANKWATTYGSAYDIVNKAKLNGGFFTYLDAPVSDKYTDMEGSTDDIGHMFLGKGLTTAQGEFTVRSGSFTDEFFTESVNRFTDRMSNGVLSSAFSGSLTLTKAALSKDVEKAELTYTLNVGTAFANFSSVDTDMEIIISVVDKSNNVTGPQELASTSVAAKGGAGDVLTGTVEVDNRVNGSSSAVYLYVKTLGAKVKVAETTLTRIQDTVVDGDNQYIDLMGDWYFHFTGNKNGLAVENLLETAKADNWPVVQPAITSWTKGFGDVTSSLGGAYFDYGIVGDGYYVRTFDVPADFDAKELVLSVGYLDDRGEAYINGEFVGATGMVDGKANGETAWAVYSYYEVDASVIKPGETNTIVVRCQNDGIGGGGWYGGPVALYSKTAFENDESTSSLFDEYVFDSEFAASAQGKEGTVENKYLVYLPEGYHTSDKYYPTVYLMHQYNSDHTSYIVDDIDTLVNEAIKQALIDEMIVVVPNSAESSWWRGDWMKMVSDELVPLIDANYRTIDDARYRFTAGCSMGGQGAFGVALQNPDLFSGAISFFGAFSKNMAGNASPIEIAKKEGADFMKNYSMYFICGNQDIYTFGQPAIELHQILLEQGVEHEFFIDNGEHNSVFYLPHFIEAFEYTRNQMYKSDEAVEKLLSGSVVEKDGELVVTFEALEGIEEYFNSIPKSSYTKNENPDLNIPLIIEIVQNGEVVYKAVARDNDINAENMAWEYVLEDVADDVDLTAEYTVVYKAAIFDRVVELGSESFNTEADDDADVDVDVDTDKDASSESVKTGDEAPVMLYAVVVMMAAVVAVVVIKRRRA